MSMLLMRRALMGGAPDIALQTILSKDAPAFYLPDPNPALRMPSSLRRGYQDFANTPVTASTQTAALALDLSEGAAIGAELAVNGGFDADSDWTKGTGWSIGSGAAAAAAATGFLDTVADVPIVTGRLYRLQFRVFDYVSGGVQPRFTGTSPVIGTVVSAAGVFDQYLFAATDDEKLSFRPVGSFTGKIDDVSIQEISGYHFYQATSADEPTLNLTSGLYGYLGDGTSKHFKTGLVGAAAQTFLFFGKVDGASDVIFGAETDANNRNLVYLSSAGKPTCLVNNSGSGAQVDTDARGLFGCVGGRYDGSNVTVFWKPLGGSLQSTTISQTANHDSTYPQFLLARNAAGTANAFVDGICNRALVQQSAYTDAEIAAIVNQWSRELAALA